MSQLSEATARYHKLIESEPYIDLAWAEELRVRLQAEKLVNQPLSPVLRPHFIGNRDYTALGKAAVTIHSAIQRAEQMVMGSPAKVKRPLRDEEVAMIQAFADNYVRYRLDYQA